MTNNEIFIDPIISELNQLEQQGFKNDGNFQMKEGKRLQTWSRKRGWKEERIQLFFYNKEPRWCEITLWLYVLVEEKPYIFMTENVCRMKRSKRQYSFPSLFRNLRAKSFNKKVVTETLQSLWWFEDKTVDKCFELLSNKTEGLHVGESLRPRLLKTLEEQKEKRTELE